MKIFNTKVYGLDEALIRSGYPMKADQSGIEDNTQYGKALQRGTKLAQVPCGTGHDKFLRSIIVQYDLIAPRYFYQEFDTYHFQETTSSQSTMHCLMKFGIKNMCNQYVCKENIQFFQKLLDNYKEKPTEENFRIAKANLPEGLELMRGVSSSYAQLKTQHIQRRTHRLPEWQYFCDWIETLPYAKELIILHG